VVVTALEAESRAGGVRVYLDGAAWATVAPADIATLELRAGALLEEARLTALTHRAEVFAAHVVALHVLRGRALPAVEITRRLVRRGHPRVAAEEAVGALVARGLINDAEFARHYVRTRAHRKGFGPGRILRDLRRLGIDEREAEAALREALAGEGLEPRQLAREAAVKKLRALAGLEPTVRERRLRAFLLRRGFARGDVVAVVREAMGK
jgi:regulatory protein